jgi:ectoine hydroxylase-related dioxygenase (phytanoyl-CoA dioxygenase family)
MTMHARQQAPSLVEEFRRNGYVILPGLFDAATRRAIAEDIAGVFARRAAALGISTPRRGDQHALTELLSAIFAADVKSYIAAAKLTQHLASVHRLGVSDAVMGVLGSLGLVAPSVSTRPVIHYIADQLKIPGGYQKTPPHQDWRSVQGSLDGVTFWSPLFDAGDGDYPLEIIPGSHRRGLLDSTPDLPNYRIRGELIEDSSFVPLSLRAGDAVVFSGFLVHRTGERGGRSVRMALSFRFNNTAEPSYVARNYPDPYLYRADPAIVTPDFPVERDLEDIFGDAS